MQTKYIILLFIFYLLLTASECNKNAEPVNHVPTVSNVQLNPTNPVEGQNLQLSFDFYDQDGDGNQSIVKWYRNNGLTGVTGNTFPSDSANANDKVKAKVQPYDGEDFGTEKSSNEVEYDRLNTAPSVSNVDISLDDATLEDTINLNYNYTDAENDADQSIIEWYNNNSLIQTGGTSLNPSNTDIDDIIKVIIKPYDGELYGADKTSDEITILPLPTVIINGKITELFNEGIPIANAAVVFGNYQTTTDSEGNYRIEVEEGSPSSRLTINHPDFYERQTSAFAPLDTLLNEDMVEGSFNMEHYDQTCRSRNQTTNPGTQRWSETPTVYIDTTAAPNLDGSTTSITQEKIDGAVAIAKELYKIAPGLFPNDQVNVEVGTNPPGISEKYIVFSWDNTIPGLGQHGELVENNLIKYAEAKVRTTSPEKVTQQELSQPLGARADSNILLSIYNDPMQTEEYTNPDLKGGKFLYSRIEGNLTPDTDP